MDNQIDLDDAAQEIAQRREAWLRRGLHVGKTTWRDQGDGWPPVIKTSRDEVKDADSVGVSLAKGDQEGSIVLFRGGWADFSYWSGAPADAPIDEAPGWNDWLTVRAFGQLLDRLADLFK